MNGAPLELWLVYDHPPDFPNSFVARKWLISAGVDTKTGDIVIGSTLESVRDQIPHGLYSYPRHETDDACIVESWF